MTATRAAFLSGDRRFALREVDLPDPGPGQVLLDVAACGVCGSNLHEWHATPPGAPGTHVPGATGHEVSAVVAAAGPGVDSLSPGDAVALDPSAAKACGRCDACLDGAAWFCAQPGPMPAFGFAERMLAFASAAHPLPEGVDVVAGSLAEPIACGVHAVRHSWTAGAGGRVDGRRVAVIGAGMLGLSAVLAARHLGAGDVVAVARHPHQKAAAEACGAATVLDADAADMPTVLRRLRPDLVVEAVGGSAGTLALALDVAAWRGEVAVLGSFDGPQTLNVPKALSREHRVFFAISYAALDGVHDMQIAVDILAAGGQELASLVTHRFPLDDVEAAFAAADDKRSGSVRVVVTP